MNAPMFIKIAGVLLVCTGIHFGLGGLLPMIVFAAGLAMLFVI